MQIVAPAGSADGLRASVFAGADAVYLGMPLFGARAKAENFDDVGLKNAVEFAHLYGVKVFITLNTLIKDDEMNKAIQAAEYAYNVGVDAAIVQDLRFIKQLKRRIPELTLHASTQMGVHNAEGAQALRDLGIMRAVLARETLPKDIAEIKKTGIEIEYFVQGALCICFSGNCYFSSLASSYSGNRGKCMHLCRKPYMFHGNRGYYLSAKDLCLYDKLNELKDLGVDAIKIEGRMRSAEYAYNAVGVYKSDMPTDKAKDMLKAVFNRGDYCSAYITKDAAFNVVYPQTQSNIGKFIGKIDKISGKQLFVKNFVPDNADGFKVMRNGKEVAGATVRNGGIVSDGQCKIGDELRRTLDGALAKSVKAARRDIDINVKINMFVGRVPEVTITSDGVTTKTVGEAKLSSAITRGITVDDITRTFLKVSDYPFSPQIEVETDGNAFMPVSALNELRRKAYAKHKAKILSSYRIDRSDGRFDGLSFNRFDGKGVILQVGDTSFLDKHILSKVDYISINPSDYACFDIPCGIDKPILLNMPITMRGEDRRILEQAIDRDGIFGVISNNLYTLKLTNKPILLGTGHNIIGDCEFNHIRSFEADDTNGGFTYVFGYAPVMTLCHCPHGKCVNCSGKDELTDESGRKFELRRYKAANCYWQLLNCVPHYLPDVKNANKFYDCTAVDGKTVKSVLDSEYIGPFTRGNIKKGLK